MAKTLKYTGDQIETRLGGNFGSDNVTCNYAVSKWLQSLSTSNLGSAPARYPVFDPKGWIYFRTPGQMKADLGLPFYGTCDTAAATQEKAVVCTDFVLKEGAIIYVKFTNAQTFNAAAASPVQLNVNSTGAKSIMRKGTTVLARYQWTAGEVLQFIYDGTNFIAVDNDFATTTYYGLTKLSSSVSSTSTSLAATPSAVKTANDNALLARKVWGTFKITSAGWSSAVTDGYYTQQISVTGMTADYYPDAIPSYTSAAVKDSEKEAWGQIDEIETVADAIIAKATSPPSVDLSFVLHGA